MIFTLSHFGIVQQISNRGQLIGNYRKKLKHIKDFKFTFTRAILIQFKVASTLKLTIFLFYKLCLDLICIDPSTVLIIAPLYNVVI